MDRLLDGAAPAPLPGVNCVPWDGGSALLRRAHECARVLVDCGVAYAHCPAGQVPWLVPPEPFVLGPALRQRLERLGEAAFAFLDAVQALYAEGHPVVRAHLDANVPPDLRGLQRERPVVTFRLDVALHDGHPKVTEIEEIYGNVGKMAAMQRAYGVDNDALFAHFAALGLRWIYADDRLAAYLPELALLQRRLAESHGMEVPVRPFSAFAPDTRGVVWRFCKTRDLAQYPPALRRAIARAPCRFVNPLFHGFGAKGVLALAFHPEAAGALAARMDAAHFAAVRAGFAHSRLLGGGAAPGDWERLASAHKRMVLKVVDCPGAPEYTWGSRGVFFGDRSAARWRNALQCAMAGSLPQAPAVRGVLYMAQELVEGDRFDVPFLHPGTGRLLLMTRARVRLTPIFFRRNGHVELTAGHATLVNSSRKIHLGRHAVCAPLDWTR